MTIDSELREMMQTLTDSEAEELEQFVTAPEDHIAEQRIMKAVTARVSAEQKAEPSRRIRHLMCITGTAAACLAAVITVVMYHRTRIPAPVSVPPAEYTATEPLTTNETGNGKPSGSVTSATAEAQYTQTGSFVSSGTVVTTQTTAVSVTEAFAVGSGEGQDLREPGEPDGAEGRDQPSGTAAPPAATSTALPPVSSTLPPRTTTSVTATTLRTTATKWHTATTMLSQTQEPPQSSSAPVCGQTTTQTETTLCKLTVTQTDTTICKPHHRIPEP